MSRRVLLATAGAVASLLTVALWFSASAKTTAPSYVAPTTVTSADTVKPSTPARAERCRFERGDRLAYTLSVSSQSEQEIPGGHEPLVSQVKLDGALHLETLETSANGAVLVGQLRGLGQGAGAAVDGRALTATPFLLRIDGSCQLQAFARHTTAPKAAARNQQSLLWETQFKTTPAAELLVQNGTGVARVSIERVSESTVRRTLRAYDSLWADGSARAVPASGVMGVELGEGPWFDALSAHEELSLKGSEVASTLTLQRTAASHAFTDAQRDAGQYVWESLLDQRPRENLVSRPFTSYDVARQKKVAGLTPTQAVSEFVDRVNRGVGVQSTWPELSAYFEVHPEEIRPAVQRYLNGELPGKAAGDFFLALGKARTPEAKEQLLELKRDESGRVMDRVRAMFALVVREDVGAPLATEFAADIIKHRSKGGSKGTFLAGESMLALSTMSGSRDDAQVTAISRQALESVVQTPSVDLDVTRVALKAVGNMGEPSMLPGLEPYMRANDIDTRKAAAHVFGRMPIAESEPVELEWLRREESPFVKKELYTVIQHQHQNLRQGAGRELVNHALADLKTTKAAYTRRFIVRLVAQSAVSQDPNVREALKAQAKYERANRTSLLNEFANILTPDEIAEVLR